EYAARRGEPGLVRALADYAIARHYPEAAGAANPYLEFYRRVIDAQASLVARWMLAGFVHGVMNTDNMAISGETIDYGPCAFMDAYHPATVFSSIDQAGRYAYGNQPVIAQWNLARLGETLVPLIDDDVNAAVEAATDAVNRFAECQDTHWMAGMSVKLGLTSADRTLVADVQTLLEDQLVDWTRFFRALSACALGNPEAARSLFAEPEGFNAWAERWQARLPADREAVAAGMDRVNPVYIPRNHLVEHALTAAADHDQAPFERLLDVITRPFDELPGLGEYALPAPPDLGPHITYCGT
ncbi:MAG TPA: protein adenylyltransferase SelO family protein, partial [Pseudonocardiaceae bacterium]|nr:protein adenylyltransferase SelO family protein [Pseudonocardiaceae bacterium]